MMLVGGQPGRIYTDTEVSQGKGNLGERLSVKDSAGGVKEYIFCMVAASQNLIGGQVVTISGGFAVTVAAVSTGSTRQDQLGVAIIAPNSTTASASNYIWVQVYGRCSVMASTSILPNIGLKIGTTAGVLTTQGAVTASAHTHGIVLTATSGVVPALTPAILNYPRYGTFSF
jgi:hypothetical protein